MHFASKHTILSGGCSGIRAILLKDVHVESSGMTQTSWFSFWMQYSLLLFLIYSAKNWHWVVGCTWKSSQGQNSGAAKNSSQWPPSTGNVLWLGLTGS